MKSKFKAFFEEHKELYKELDLRLKEISKNKKEIDSEHLLLEVEKLLTFVSNLLDDHFREEEKVFEQIEVPENSRKLFQKILNDHQEIREKHKTINSNFKKIIQNSEDNDSELQKKLLFPSYNLIATINHHAQREDKFFNT